MTIGCARCHDHKIDPVSQRDYYSMLSFFSDISPHGKGRTNHVTISTPLDKAEFERKMAEKQNREMELQVAQDLSSAFAEVDRAYAVSRVNFNRREAALRQPGSSG